jgi:hypothetical protein
MNTRTLKDGNTVPELDEPVVLTIKTKCPAKWLLVDQETGEAYIPNDSPDPLQWKKLYKAEWSIDA